MVNKSSEANPNPDRQDDRSNTSQEDPAASEYDQRDRLQDDPTASVSAEELREILKSLNPGKASLDEGDITPLRRKLEKGQVAPPNRNAKDAPNLRCVHPSDQPSGSVSESGSQPKPEKVDRECDPRPDYREEMYRNALLRWIKGETLQQIADRYNRSPRCIQRWIKKAKERNLLRVDKIKPAQELATALFMLRQHRAKLMHLQDQLLENDQFKEGLRAIDMLAKLEERIIRIQHRVGVFDGYMWCDIKDSLPGSPGRRKVDDGEDDDIENAA